VNCGSFSRISILILWAISGCRWLMRCPAGTLYIDLSGRKPMHVRRWIDFRRATNHTFGDTTTSGLGGHIAISVVGSR